ncbi:3-demethylubiquinone-9 3-methyltransferase [Trypanosoma theileri]|uniref:Ubiquinone biosynthesis O-methyltransferase, mitochondrial n=1 Tax=Trypanosoma theileri TaxID=67003 RepID=A0A1X0P511_9TRYP|nr:3-demethylubiquinone-9 3-methyltransferase [Trypanosoma theileri]ORC92034.1 3-demethylubiquinone-9 3-methyltransferase [Trypanosoma theileri]
MTTVASHGASAAELAKFRQLQRHWWDPDGPLRTLHLLNPARVAYIHRACQQYARRNTPHTTADALRGMRVLDVGCGGGVLSESLARLGGHVLGIDAGAEGVAVALRRRGQLLRSVAHTHGELVQLNYRHVSLHTIAQEEKQQFDLVVASEVMEHVEDAAGFVQDLCAATKPGGILVVSTMDKSFRAAVGFIGVAEYITGLVPPGTHDWTKFVPPKDLSRCALTHQVREVDLQYVMACPDVLRSIATRQLQLSFSLTNKIDTGHYFWTGVKMPTPVATTVA